MNKQEAEQRLASIRAGARREALVQSGAYDGRYRSRVVQSKKHKAEKYKRRALDPSYRDWETDRKSTRLNSSHSAKSRMPSSA